MAPTYFAMLRAYELLQNRADQWKKMEGINRKIRGLLASAFGFRDQDFLKLRLYVSRRS